MKLSKQTAFVGIKSFAHTDNYCKTVDTDLANLFVATKGRLRFGNGTDGERGENLAGAFASFTSSSTANQEFTVAHTVGAIPIGYFVVSKDKAAHLYKGTTSWTKTSVYFKSDVASVAFVIFLLK